MKQGKILVSVVLFILLLFCLKVLSDSYHRLVDVALYFFIVVLLLAFGNALLGIVIRWLVYVLHNTFLFIPTQIKA